MKEYKGIFSELLPNFVVFKRALGFKYDVQAIELYRFSVFSTRFKLAVPALTKDIVQAWSSSRPNEGLKSNSNRVSILRQFALYLNSLGYKAYVAPFEGNSHNSTFIPYIFTHSEIERIFTSSDRLWPHRGSNMHLVLPVILRMLYSCGLRSSEAVNL